jgi:DNA-binding GntR family transcriptional regulator
VSTAESSVDKILREFLAEIEEGRLVPGQRIIPGEIAKRLGVGRSTVREAIHVLAGEGVFELTKNLGARVRELPPEDLVYGMQVLRAVAALGIELAVPRLAAPENRRRVERELGKITKIGVSRQPYQWFIGLVDFHRVINDISGNHYINDQVFGRLHLPFFCRALAVRLPGTHWPKYIRNYERIGHAVLSGQPSTAVAAFLRHMDWAIGLLESEFIRSPRAG